MDLEELRREYLRGGLKHEDLQLNPIAQFELWMQQAIATDMADPTAMTVATVSAGGQPSQRIVLLKHLDERGFVFYTNFASKKAQNIAVNSKVSLHFPWHAIERQVNVCGVARKLDSVESLKYFSSRPRESQLGAWASRQSQKVSSRQLLMQQFNAMKEKFAKGDIPLPEFWGGYIIKPSSIEFWQGGANRLHDRFEYSRGNSGEWIIDRLAP